MIDRWFPVAAVDEACGTTAGSGLTEKAMFTWFASRPIAQARAAALTSLLPDETSLKPQIEAAIRSGDPNAIKALSARILETYDGRPPVVLDMFSGRGIIPLEAARAGATAIGFDLSPVATLAGRLLGTYPSRDWSQEPPLPFAIDDASDVLSLGTHGDRYACDIRTLLTVIGKRFADRVCAFYPRSTNGQFPWAYLWAVTMPCDECKRVFPMLGSLMLRYPYKRISDQGQSLHLEVDGSSWRAKVVDGLPSQQPNYASGTKADGKKKKGKAARCLFCGFIHSLDAVKSKGQAGQFNDSLIVVGETDAKGKRQFRVPTGLERDVAENVTLDVQYGGPYSTVPDEVIPSGNVHTVMASGYGYHTFGDLMCTRQTRSFVEMVQIVRETHREMLTAGLSEAYARALTSYAAATVCRKVRWSTRGARLRTEGREDGSANNVSRIDHIFSHESKVYFQFDFLEAGPGIGPGTWDSVSDTAVRAIQKVAESKNGSGVNLRQASATALPLRDNSVDAVITDPPYYDMIEYADASDIFHVWLKRMLYDIEPDLFAPDVQLPDGLQDKNQEIIVRRVHEPKRLRHDTEFYESMLAKSFGEARRILKPDGHLVVMFGHSDPDAWRRLLGALQTAGFVVTSAWPSRTESANTGVASIKVTVTIGCRVADVDRPLGIGAEVDREVAEAVVERVGQWDADGLALEDQLMASYGPAMEVYGRYSRVINPDGTDADLDHYLALARRAVRDAMRLRVDELPLETFDSITRFAIFWLRAKGRAEVPKGEALFFAQADELHLDSLRDRILIESKAGFQLRLVDEKPVTETSSMFEVVRAMAHAWDSGGMEAVATTIATAGLEPNNQHLWAVVGDLANNLPASDKTAKALTGIKRSSSTISTLVGSVQSATKQSGLFDPVGA
jgi:putative DNA methylase